MQENSTTNLKLASMKFRSFNYVFVYLLITVIIMVIFWNSIISHSDDMEAMMFLMKTDLVMPLIALKVAYHTFFIWYFGATVGKIVAKIRVIDVDSWGKVSFFSSFLRSVGRIFSEMFFYVGFLIGFFNEGRRTFHDITGKTLVVNV